MTSTLHTEVCYPAARAAGTLPAETPHVLVAGVCSGCGLIPCPMPGDAETRPPVTGTAGLLEPGEAVYDRVEGYCDADLYVEVVGSVPLGRDVLEPDARGVLTLDDAVTRSYRVTCPQGHTILLPPDTAEDDYWYDADAHARLLETVARLRGVRRPSPAEVRDAVALTMTAHGSGLTPGTTADLVVDVLRRQGFTS